VPNSGKPEFGWERAALLLQHRGMGGEVRIHRWHPRIPTLSQTGYIDANGAFGPSNVDTMFHYGNGPVLLVARPCGQDVSDQPGRGGRQSQSPERPSIIHWGYCLLLAGTDRTYRGEPRVSDLCRPLTYFLPALSSALCLACSFNQSSEPCSHWNWLRFPRRRKIDSAFSTNPT
jgi:hypothetical protein